MRLIWPALALLASVPLPVVATAKQCKAGRPRPHMPDAGLEIFANGACSESRELPIAISQWAVGHYRKTTVNPVKSMCDCLQSQLANGENAQWSLCSIPAELGKAEPVALANACICFQQVMTVYKTPTQFPAASKPSETRELPNNYALGAPPTITHSPAVTNGEMLFATCSVSTSLVISGASTSTLLVTVTNTVGQPSTSPVGARSNGVHSTYSVSTSVSIGDTRTPTFWSTATTSLSSMSTIRTDTSSSRVQPISSSSTVSDFTASSHSPTTSSSKTASGSTENGTSNGIPVTTTSSITGSLTGVASTSGTINSASFTVTTIASPQPTTATQVDTSSNGVHPTFSSSIPSSFISSSTSTSTTFSSTSSSSTPSGASSSAVFSSSSSNTEPTQMETSSDGVHPTFLTSSSVISATSVATSSTPPSPTSSTATSTTPSTTESTTASTISSSALTTSITSPGTTEGIVSSSTSSSTMETIPISTALSSTESSTTESSPSSSSTTFGNITETSTAESRTTESSPSSSSTTFGNFTETSTTESRTTESSTMEISITETSIAESSTSERNPTSTNTTQTSTMETRSTETSVAASSTLSSNSISISITEASKTESSTTEISAMRTSTTDSSATKNSTIQGSTAESSTLSSSTTPISTTETSTMDNSTVKSSTTESSVMETSTTETSTLETRTTENSTRFSSTTEASTAESSITETGSSEISTSEISPIRTSTTESSTTENSTIQSSTTESSPLSSSAASNSTTQTSTSTSSITNRRTLGTSTPESTITESTTMKSSSTEISTIGTGTTGSSTTNSISAAFSTSESSVRETSIIRTPTTNTSATETSTMGITAQSSTLPSSVTFSSTTDTSTEESNIMEISTTEIRTTESITTEASATETSTEIISIESSTTTSSTLSNTTTSSSATDTSNAESSTTETTATTPMGTTAESSSLPSSTTFSSTTEISSMGTSTTETSTTESSTTSSSSTDTALPTSTTDTTSSSSQVITTDTDSTASQPTTLSQASSTDQTSSSSITTTSSDISTITSGSSSSTTVFPTDAVGTTSEFDGPLTLDAAPTVTLMPAPPFGIDQGSLDVVTPANTNQLWYTSPPDDASEITGTILRLNMTYQHLSVALDQSIYIRSVTCAGSTLTTVFGDAGVYSYAAPIWRATSQILFITATSSCSIDGQNEFFLTSGSPSCDDASQTCSATVTIVNLGDVFSNLDADLGAIEVDTTASTTTTANPTACSAPPATSISNLPAASCGPGFDQTIDSGLGYYSGAESDVDVVLAQIAPGTQSSTPKRSLFDLLVAKMAAITQRGISKRGLFSFVSAAVTRVASAVKTVATTVAKAVVTVAAKVVAPAAQFVARAAVSIAKTTVAAAKAVYNVVKFVVTGNYNQSFNLHLDMAPPSSLLTQSPYNNNELGFRFYKFGVSKQDPGYSLWENALELLGNQLGANAKPEPGVELWCIDCGIKGDITTTGLISANLGGVTNAQVKISGSMYAGLFVGIDAFATIKRQYSRQILMRGLPTLSIPKVFTLGPSISLNVSAEARIELLGRALTGASLSWPSIAGTLDFLDSSKSSTSGFTPVLNATLQVTEGAKLILSFELPISVNFGFDILDGKYKKEASLIDTPSLQAIMDYEEQSSVTGSTGNGGCATINTIPSTNCYGVYWNISAVNDVELDLFGRATYNLDHYESNKIAEGCVGTEASSAGNIDTCTSTSSAPVGQQTTATTEMPATTTTAGPPCTSTINGLRWAYYTAPSDFNIDEVHNSAPLATGLALAENGIDNLIIDDGQPITSIYQTPVPSLPQDFFFLSHVGYIYAYVAGSYVFTSNNVDDDLYMWWGPNAISAWNSGNADLRTTVGDDFTSVTVYLQQGQYYPIRIIYDQKYGNEFWFYSLSDPNGDDILSMASPYIVSDSCDGAAFVP
ncbi:hypothetical protein JX265_010927 [Neoarthrinium moseri]|uniref:PA14 domain-containing protein n=1 Tax=Neoarthrinium moseri TaxID=1658444 RepID=A0A9P9WDF6_9PEZI|nr:hypothetical protein JX265_010927 [Neoarthrinium moseri]